MIPIEDTHDDLIEYCRMRPTQTGLNVEIFLDDGEAYKRNQHQMWVYMQNDYGCISNVYPVIVDQVEQTAFDPEHIRISQTDFQQVLEYITGNKRLIEQLADLKIGHLDYIDSHKRIE